jgi:DivIVA domain-containing protein
MEMSPQRVRSAEFKTVRKGVDPDEVRVFLDDVADELERAQNQSTAMEARARAAVARLQEVSESGAAIPSPTVEVSADEAETISRTLVLAQRTADTTVAEARREAARIVGAADDEAATTLDSTREMAAQLLDEARLEARRLGETERMTIAGEVDSLKARRDFLESDVQQLELFLTDQRSRLREAATSLVDITERIPGGLGEVRRPLLSASDDEPTWSTGAATTAMVGGGGDERHEHRADVSATTEQSPDDDLVIMTELEDEEPAHHEATGSDSSVVPDDATQAMPAVEQDGDDRSEHDGDDFRFSFDLERG